MTALPIVTRFTEAEYLGLENASRERHEYVDGYIVAVAGASLRHADVCANLAAELRRLSEHRCKVAIADLRVHVAASGRYFYPDLVVACGDRVMRTLPEGAAALTNPTVMVEVLSRTTREYDRGPKLASYQTIPSLLDIVLVDPVELAIEVWSRGSEGWHRSRARAGDAALSLGALSVEAVFRDIAPLDPDKD